MRALAIATFVVFVAATAVAQSVVVPHPVPNFHERINSCGADRRITPASQRSTMSYRQFTTRCLEGDRARPIETVALCNNGTTAPATASGGPCAYDGGVERWLD